MADKYGAAHRKLVEDTNKGKVQPAPAQRTSSVAKQGAGITHVGDDGKTELYRSLLSVGEEVVGRIAARKERLDYAEGYNRGLEEGFIEKERSPIREFLFGPSATMRGAQKRIVEHDSARWYNARLKSMEDDMMAFDEDEYQEELSEQLRQTLEEHDDPEIKAQITEQAAKHFETLARTHAQARQMWVDDANQRAVKDLVASSVNTVQAARRYGDEKAVAEAMIDAELMFDQPLDMNPEVWLDTVASTVSDFLAKGESLAYDLAEEKGILAQMSPTAQNKIKSAYELFEAKQGREFYTDQLALQDRIAAGDATDADLIAFKQKYPEQGDDLNTLRQTKTEADRELAEIARQKALTIQELVSGDVKFNSREPREQREAVTSVFNTLADRGLEVMRQNAYDEGLFEGDMDAPFTDEERMNYMLDNPMQFAQVWAMHPEVKTPLIQNIATTMLSDIRREDLDQEGVELLHRRYEALKQFQALDGGNFHNQFRSDEDASMFAAYSYLVSDANYNPINAVRELRQIAGREDINIADYKVAIEDNLDELEDDFLDQSPESQAFFGLFTKTPDNEDAFRHELRTRLQDAVKLFKGDMDKAIPAAKAAVRRNGIVSNGQFIPNGRKLQIQGGSVEDFIRGINASDEMRAQITNSGAGFAPDVDYTSLELSVNPFNPKTVIMHGRHEKTGQPITITLNLPQHSEQFLPYGFNSFTGYNPYIADTKERKRAFLRNNKLLKGYRTLGQAIERIVE